MIWYGVTVVPRLIRWDLVKNEERLVGLQPYTHRCRYAGVTTALGGRYCDDMGALVTLGLYVGFARSSPSPTTAVVPIVIRVTGLGLLG